MNSVMNITDAPTLKHGAETMSPEIVAQQVVTDIFTRLLINREIMLQDEVTAMIRANPGRYGRNFTPRELAEIYRHFVRQCRETIRNMPTANEAA